ncbi:DUF192 domain-containing protein [Halobellus rufus]|uniref:DUF192 domain-containing protein n=1 Tax=Halobellus rufus TaxID=1448860 RepID=UPI00067930A1|nr:DUF192 domain-containing protein [Halobellus rufus]
MPDGSRLATALVAVAVLLAVGVVAVASNPGLLPTGEYERTSVTLVDGDTDETLATVNARVADTQSKRYTGLSETDSLGANEGMLFVHDEEGQYAYVMRDMAFPIDIVFVDGEGTITAIHHAELPPEGTSNDDLRRYRGRGKYVLEVPYNYTSERGVEIGDRIRIDGEWGPASTAES